MSIENVKAFREAVNESKELQEKIAAGEDWVEVAKAANFEFTAEELRNFSIMFEDGDEELSDSELAAASGGAMFKKTPPGTPDTTQVDGVPSGARAWGSGWRRNFSWGQPPVCLFGRARSWNNGRRGRGESGVNVGSCSR